MKPVYRILSGGLFVLGLATGCRISDKSASNTSSSGSNFSCTYKRSGDLNLCTQYQGLSGTTLTSIQSECELRGTEGYSWATLACPDNSVGRCSLPSTPKTNAPGVQYYYGAAFASQDTAAKMCSAQNGTYN